VCGTGTRTGLLPGDPDNSSILTATSEFGGIRLNWTMPNVNAFAVAHTRVFRGTTPDFEKAVQIAVVSGNEYFDADAANAIQRYYYWIQHVSINGTQLPPVGPASAIPKPEIDKVIEQLANRIEFGHLATQLRSRINLITDLEAGITQINNTIVRENSILTQELQALRDDLTNAVAYINTQTQIASTERQALAESVTTMVAALNDNLTAAIQEEARVRAEETGALFGEKFMKIDLAGNVSGYGLAAYVDPQGNATSDFQVRADTFSIAPPAVHSRTPPTGGFHGKVWMDTSTNPPTPKWYNSNTRQWQTTPVKGAVPFIVKTTAETTPDGYTIPPGVYIDSAYISRLNAQQIDTRGLTIRDAQGNVIFGAGVNLSVDRISGLGSLAKQNSVNASQVNGLGALATQNNVFIGSTVRFPDGTVMNTGDFINRLSKIGRNNISTFIESGAIGSAYIGYAAIGAAHIQDAAITNAKIANAAITTAKIQDLSVDRFKLANQAVSVIASAYGMNYCSTAITIPSGVTGNIVAIVTSDSTVARSSFDPIASALCIDIGGSQTCTIVPWHSRNDIYFVEGATHSTLRTQMTPGTYTVNASFKPRHNNYNAQVPLTLIVIATWK